MQRYPLEESVPAPSPRTPEARLFLAVVVQAARDVGRDDTLGHSARAFLDDPHVQYIVRKTWGVSVDSHVDPQFAARQIHRYNVERRRRATMIIEGRREEMPTKRRAVSDKIKVGYYITRTARDHLQQLAKQESRSISAQVEVLIQQAWEERDSAAARTRQS
jgi:hypothetical protein